MNSHDVTNAEHLVVLVGGPPEMARVYRIPGQIAATSERIAVAYYGQHQHFEPTGETELVEGRMMPVFRFTYSTKIAE
ncbi:DUF5988 family protein [Streptomyces sp. AN091965]|uniref:DUF5988 family protein n=1 Tax=Streptomyces sp. AN091965 TaxID=2927803 RepID=UPI001F61DEAA|nr:DUF5988 family protein [Streptomyces sp. AN091965]MCI3927838.1 DUF5988 family protein [Streptomyces sp. AN091965]